MASTAKQNIDTSKLTPEYLIPKIDLLGITQLSIDAIPSVEELRYLGKENLDALKLILRGLERKLRMASMKVEVAVSLTKVDPEAWRSYRPIDTITEETEKTEAWKAFTEKVNSNPQTAVLTSDLDFLKEFESRLTVTGSAGGAGEKIPGVTYKCNCLPAADSMVPPSCRFGVYVTAWCRSEKAERCNLSGAGTCGSCRECNSISCHKETCVFAEANQEMLNRCKKFLHGLRGRLTVSQDVMAAYIRRVCAAIDGAQSKPLFSVWRNPSWAALGEVVFVVDDLVEPTFGLGQVTKLEDPDCPVVSVKIEQNDPAPYSFCTAEIMKPIEYNYLCTHEEYRKLWLSFSCQVQSDEESARRALKAFQKNAYIPAF